MPAIKHAGRPVVLGTALAAALTVTVPATTAQATAPAASTRPAATATTTSTAGTGARTAVTARVAARTAKVHRAWQVARHQLGAPYAYGRSGPGAFDCSGLTYYAFHRKAHFRGFPRTSGAQARYAHPIKRSQLRRGDLVFFTSGGHVYHAAIFAGWRHGHRVVLHAPHPGTRVRIDPIWTSHWMARTLRH
jgi:cell wall-associated NlpC family hydrolase